MDGALHTHDGYDGRVHCIAAELPIIPIALDIATPNPNPSYARPYA